MTYKNSFINISPFNKGEFMPLELSIIRSYENIAADQNVTRTEDRNKRYTLCEFSHLNLYGAKMVQIFGNARQSSVNLSNCEVIKIDLPFSARIRIFNECKNISITIKNVPNTSAINPKTLGDRITVEGQNCSNITLNGLKIA